MQTELEHELSFLAIESVRETEIRERTKREDERRLEWLEKKRKKERDGSGQPDPVFFSETLPGSKIGPGCPPHLTQSDPQAKQKL